MAQEPAVCHIAPETTIEQPSPTNLPAIPPARPDVASLTATVNAMRQVIMILSGQQGTQGPRGSAGKDASAKGTWSEKKGDRVTDKVKIYSKTDPTQFVEIEQVNAITMENRDTKQTWKWTR